MSRIEVMSGIERRRRWSTDEKRRLVSAAFSPGAVVSEVARRADIHPNQLYRWRQELQSFSPGFAELVVTGDFPPTVPVTVPDPSGTGIIEVVIADRTRLRLPVSTSPAWKHVYGVSDSHLRFVENRLARLMHDAVQRPGFCANF